MDLATMVPADQDFTATFELTGHCTSSDSTTDQGSTSDGGGSTVQVAAVVLWFDVDFSGRFCKEQPVKLSTSPQNDVTHWAQAVLPLAHPVLLPKADTSSSSSNSSLHCRLSMARSRSKHRSLDISLEYSCPAVSIPRTIRTFTMEVSG
jgi:protein arginine N-methyltransferase 3